MILHPYIIATMAVALATIQGVGAFISSSGYNILQRQARHQQHSLSSFELAVSFQPPIIPHSSSSNEDEEEDEMDPVWESPYNHLFRSQLQHQQQHGITMNTSKAQQYQKKSNVHIVLFNPGLQTEGVHTIKHSGSGSNVILAFESYKDCQFFAKNLGRQNMSNSIPMPQKIHRQNLKAYAIALGMTVQVIPQGSNLNPPDRNHNWNMSDREQEVPLLMKLKEEKTCLDRLIESSPLHSSSASEFEWSPVWG